MRILIIIGIVAVIFGLFNVIAFRLLTRLHPRRKPIVLVLAIVCNLMWLFLPLLNARTDFSRLIRAILGPPWFAWLCFVILYSLVIAVLLLAWIPFHKRTTFDDFARQPSRAFLWFVLIGGVIGVYQALVPLRVEHVPVRMPAGVAGKKLVLIADLHTGLFTRTSRLETIFRTAAAQHPDAIVLAGDLIDDDPYFTPKLIAATQVVPPSIPILATLGNHETYGAPFEHIANCAAATSGCWSTKASPSAASGSPASPTTPRCRTSRSSRPTSTPRCTASRRTPSRSSSRINRERFPRPSGAAFR